jgi:hypothetical protein
VDIQEDRSQRQEEKEAVSSRYRNEKVSIDQQLCQLIFTHIQRFRILRHQSLTCLIIDGEVAAFPTIHRDEDLLALPLPNIILQLNGEASTRRALLRLKKAKHIKLLQIDTAIFSYEPILKALQDIRDLPLSEELLFWKPGKAVGLLPTIADKVVSALRYDPNQDLQPIVHTVKSIKLDDSQAESLLAGLTQQVSLIQGPPGKVFHLFVVGKKN